MQDINKDMIDINKDLSQISESNQLSFYINFERENFNKQNLKFFQRLGNVLLQFLKVSKLQVEISDQGFQKLGKDVIKKYVDQIYLVSIPQMEEKENDTQQQKCEDDYDYTSKSASLQFLNQINIYITTKTITLEDMKGLNECLNNLFNLSEISLTIGTNCSLEAESCQQLGMIFKKFSDLSKLSLKINNKNNIQESGSLGISQGLKNILTLRSLTLIIEENQIKSDGAICIGNALKSLVNLQYLLIQFGGNNIKQEGAKGLAEGIKYLINLQALSIRISKGNNIGEEGAVKIGQAIQNLKSLTQLTFNIETNYIGEEGAQALGQGYKFLFQLNKLSFNIGFQNLIYTKGALGLIDGLKELKKLNFLEVVILQGNYIGLESINRLIQGIKNAKFLSNIHFKIQEAPQFERNLIKQSKRLAKRLVQINQIQV